MTTNKARPRLWRCLPAVLVVFLAVYDCYGATESRSQADPAEARHAEHRSHPLSTRHPLAVQSPSAVNVLHSHTAALHPYHQLASSLEPADQNITATSVEPRDYYVFHDVYLQNNSLLYFTTKDGPPVPADLPTNLRLSRYEIQIDFPIIIVNSSNRQEYPQQCTRHGLVSKPALLFSGTIWDTNIFEFFGTTYMALFQTATMTDLLDPDRIRSLEQLSRREDMLAEMHNPASMAPFTLITGRPFIFGTPWSYLYEFLTTDIVSLQHLHRACYKTLIVHEDAVLRFLYERVVEMREARYRQYRAEWLAKFQQHLIAAERIRLRQFEQPWPASIGDDGKPLQRPRVVIASRPPRRRGILNELDLIQHLTSKWDVNVTVTNFRMGLAGAIALMQETDVLLGMHGAGLTNAFWLKKGAVMLQLLPYAWEVYPGQLIRSCLSADIPSAFQGHYLQWVNPHAYNAWFNKDDVEQAMADWESHPTWGPKLTKLTEQPNNDTVLPRDPDSPGFWMYQNTYVDMASFGPVLDQAMDLAKARRL